MTEDSLNKALAYIALAGSVATTIMSILSEVQKIRQSSNSNSNK